VFLFSLHEELVLMEVSPFLPLLDGLSLSQVFTEGPQLTVEVTSTRGCSCCPLCGQASSAIHSHYSRTLRDAPCGGQQVVLHLTVRKFFCRNPLCPRKVFTERLPTFVEPWARMTLRLERLIQAIGLATCGKLGARLAARLSIATSSMTILRRVMDLPTKSAGEVSHLGIDDFGATRKVAYVAVRTRRMEDLTWGSAPSALPG
jgi:transposase